MTDRQPAPGVHENFAANLVDELESCPICSKQFRPEDKCSTDIELGICHAACLEGSPVVDLDTGEPMDGAPDTYRYSDTAPPPQSHLGGPDFGSHGSATAMFDVIAERLRQQEKEGWTPEHDDKHADGELAQAAAVYAHPFKIRLAGRRDEYDRGTNAWPWYDQVDVSGGRGEFPVWGWQPAWLKKTDRRRDLVKAAALIIAEIERLDRAAIATTEGSDNG